MKFMKTKTISRLLMLFALVCFSTVCANAQVKIGSNTAPDTQSVLDLHSGGTKGFLPPRVLLSAQDDPSPFQAPLAPGMTVYNTSGAGLLAAGIFTWNGELWIGGGGGDNWFYMPSTVVDTTEGTGKILDLYAKYADQFKTTAIGSTGSPEFKYPAPTSDQFYYYVIGYDDTVFENVSINAAGVMTYDIKSPATERTYINIVFVRK